MTSCPRCGEGVAAGQEYCLECGLRLVGAGRLAPPPVDGRRVMVSVTARGRKVVDDIMPKFNRHEALVTQALNELQSTTEA